MLTFDFSGATPGSTAGHSPCPPLAQATILAGLFAEMAAEQYKDHAGLYHQLLLVR